MEEPRSDDTSSSLCSSGPPRVNAKKHVGSSDHVNIIWSEAVRNVSPAPGFT